MPRRNQTPPHQQFQFVSNCKQKKRFANERQAQEAADYQMLLRPDMTLSVYRCELCGGWHLTRRASK
jgi:hypothetical protein